MRINARFYHQPTFCPACGCGLTVASPADPRRTSVVPPITAGCLSICVTCHRTLVWTDLELYRCLSEAEELALPPLLQHDLAAAKRRLPLGRHL